MQSSQVKLGDQTGSTVAQSGSSATHIVSAGHSYSSTPLVQSTINQPTSSVTQSGLINFASAFATFTAQSTDMASCANTLVLTDANGTPLRFPLAPSTNAYITLTPGAQNVLDISAANLANISILQFRNLPTSTAPLVINVDTSGVGNNFSWTTPNINGFTNSAGAPYLTWNFPTATQLTIGDSSTVPGTVYAPGATLNDNDQNGLAGGVIAAAYAQGGTGGNPSGGQVIPLPLAASIQSCATAQMTISLTADTGTAAPGGTVHYTITVTNSGSVAYTGATFTDALSDVLDDASYNNNAAATAGSVGFTSPNLTWTGNLAAGAAATITFSVTVTSPDTGDKLLTSTVTSATPGGNCPAGGTDPRCTAIVSVAVLTIVNTASVGTTTPGSKLTFTIIVADTGPPPTPARP